MWWVSLLGALAALLSGALDWSAAGEVLARIGPVLVFLVGVTVIAELTDAAGVFDVAAREAAHLGRGRTWRLWLMVVALASVSTIVLSLDTTAVLLTPVVLSMARQLDIPPRLFATTTVWLAGTASLLLPVSNLTNLLATHRMHALGIDLAGYLALSWRPALAAIAATVLVIAVLFRRDLRRRYQVPATPGWPTSRCSGPVWRSARCSGRRSCPGSTWPGRRLRVLCCSPGRSRYDAASCCAGRCCPGGSSAP